jgi:hypothetical protein
MNRRKRHPHTLIHSAVLSALGALGVYSHREPFFAPDGGGGGGGGDAGGGGGGGAGTGEGDAGNGAGGGGGTPPATVPRTELNTVIGQRDKIKATQRAAIADFAAALGIDPEDVKIVETGDKAKPYKLEAPGLAEAATALKEARSKSGVKWEQKEAELNDRHQRKVQQLTETGNRRENGLKSFINRQDSVVPIQLAAAAEGAIDAEDNTLVTLLQPRIKTTIEIDDETGETKVTTVPLQEDGEPMLDKQGNPATIRQLVAEYLNKKPHLRKATFRSGSGAGGNGGQGGGPAPAAGGAGKKAAQAMFGVKPA